MKRTVFAKISVILLILAGFILMNGSATGEDKEYWSENIVAVIARKSGSNIEFHVKNTATYDITITITFSHLDNLKTDKWWNDVTLAVPGNTTLKAITLIPKNHSRPTNYNFRYIWMPGPYKVNHSWGYVYDLPYETGKSFNVIQGYGGSFSHSGNNQNCIDFDMPIGTKILASREGTVVGIKDDSKVGGSDPGFKKHGNFVLVRHSDGTYAEYYHLDHKGVRVKVGQRVSKGQLLGLSGNTGYSTTPHLHTSVFKCVDGSTRQTYKVKYRTTQGNKTLKQGQTYMAP